MTFIGVPVGKGERCADEIWTGQIEMDNLRTPLSQEPKQATCGKGYRPPRIAPRRPGCSFLQAAAVQPPECPPASSWSARRPRSVIQ